MEKTLNGHDHLPEPESPAQQRAGASSPGRAPLSRFRNTAGYGLISPTSWRIQPSYSSIPYCNPKKVLR
jgi:hypothetical protein